MPYIRLALALICEIIACMSTAYGKFLYAFCGIFAPVFLWANFASAHVKWFASTGVSVPEGTPLLAPILWWVAVSCVVVAGAFSLDKSILYRTSFFGRGAGESFIAKALLFFSGILGVFLVFSATDGVLFSQNLTLLDPYSPLILMEVVAGILLATGFFVRVGALLLALLWLFSFVAFPAISIFENIWVVASALYIFFATPKPFPAIFINIAVFVVRARAYASDILRVLVGLNLFILGFSEKILNPELGLAFLSLYDWNFMHYLGINFSDYAFVISAGFTEALFGVLFVLGLMTRANALIAGTLFFIPLFILGPAELTGHIPYFVTIGMLFVLGSGRRV